MGKKSSKRVVRPVAQEALDWILLRVLRGALSGGLRKALPVTGGKWRSEELVCRDVRRAQLLGRYVTATV